MHLYPLYRARIWPKLTSTEARREPNDEETQLQYHKGTVQQHAYPIHQAKADGVYWSRYIWIHTRYSVD